MLKFPTNHMRPTKLGKKAADYLRKEILEGRIKPGQNLPSENDLMKSFGISRPTLREAIRILESLGLVVVYRGKKGGAEVRLPTIAVTAANAAIYLQSQQTTLYDLHEARTCIEPTLVVLLAGKVKKKDLKELRGLLDRAEEATTDTEKYARVITDYHSRLFALLGNHFLDLISSVMHSVMEPLVAAQIADYRDTDRRKNLLENIAAQRQILDLMEAGNFEQAGEFCRQNLMRLGRVLIKTGGGGKLVDSQVEHF